MQVNGIRVNSHMTEDPNITRFDMANGALGTGLQRNNAKRIVVISDGPEIKPLHGQPGEFTNDKIIPPSRIKTIINVRESGGAPMYDVNGNLIKER